MTTFHTPRNNVATTVATARGAGSPALVVADGSGFGATFPLIATAVRGSAVLAILEVSGRSGNTLTVSGAIEGTTDVALVVGDKVEMRPTALALTEVHAAIHALETFTHDQPVASASWTIAHNLGRFPSITVIDSAGSVVIGEATYLSADSLRLDFSGAFAGKAYLN